MPKTYDKITGLPPAKGVAAKSSGPALKEVEAKYREKLKREAADQETVDIPDPPAQTATKTSVTANAIAPPATETADKFTLETLQEHRRRLDAVQSQVLEVLGRLDKLDSRVGEMLLVLPEIRQAISRKQLDEIVSTAPSTELVVLNEPHWEHHGTKFAHGRVMQPSHYPRQLAGWMDRGLRLGRNQ